MTGQTVTTAARAASLAAVFLTMILLGPGGCSGDRPETGDAAAEPKASTETTTPTAAGDTDRTITLVADAWPPYNCAEDDVNEGYMIDIARAVFAAEGHDVNYVIVPWQRALAGTRSGQYDGVVAASKVEAAGFIFPEQELLRSGLWFYTHRTSDWTFDGPTSLADVALGVASGYDYTGWLNDYIEQHQNDPHRVQSLVGDFPLQQNLRKLLAGRIGAMAGDDGCVRYTAQQMGVLDELRLAGNDPEEVWCYIAFSPATGRGQNQAEMFDRGLRRLRTSGELAEILGRYGLMDWVNRASDQGRDR